MYLLHVDLIIFKSHALANVRFYFQTAQETTLPGVMGYLAEEHNKEKTEIRDKHLNLKTDGKSEIEAEMILRQELDSSSRGKLQNLFLISLSVVYVSLFILG